MDALSKLQQRWVPCIDSFIGYLKSLKVYRMAVNCVANRPC